MLESNSNPRLDILVLGAGPAGLALGRELKERGLHFLILEKGSTVGESWRRMPTHLKLVSPWKTNALPGTSSRRHPAHYQISRADFLIYLREYAAENALPVRTGTEVVAVVRNPAGGFHVRTAREEWAARFVVNATGYFSQPFVPDIPGARASVIPHFHVAEFKDAAQVRSRLGRSAGRVLIVGKRLSAGQTMVELVDAGFEVSLSHRSPIQFGVGPFAWWFLYRTFPWLEWLQLQMRGAKAPAPDVRMQGGRARQLIQSGAVQTFPALLAIEGGRAVFENRETLTPDLILYATGFRPALNHLAPLGLEHDSETSSPKLCDLESVTVPGLFFLGLDRARNFQSRFLRGIRRDATFLAGRLQEKLREPARSHNQ